MTDLRALGERIQGEAESFDLLAAEVSRVVVGQDDMVRGILLGLLTGGHVLLEGLPGLAKTLAVNAVCKAVGGTFSRVQFTPDLLPSDIVGTVLYNPQRGEFSSKLGPIFANFVLADEINRAPAKVQSALLEAMQERKVTLGDQSYALPSPFLVLATQNPVEQEGTYDLPEAQVDRFTLKIRVGYPGRSDERKIMDRMTAPEAPHTRQVMSLETLEHGRTLCRELYMDDKVSDYIVNLVCATRDPAGSRMGEFASLIEYGASPRASIALNLVSRARAFLMKRAYVTPEDVKAVAPDVLGHRIKLSYEAEAQNVRASTVVNRLLEAVEVP